MLAATQGSHYLGKCVLIKISHTIVKKNNNTFLFNFYKGLKMLMNWRKKLWFVKKDIFLTSAVKFYEYASDDFYNLTFQIDEKNM